MSWNIRLGWGALEELGTVAGELGLARLLLVTSARWLGAAGGLPVAGAYGGVRPHAPVETVEEAAARAEELDADGLVGLGGGSAIDTCKAVAYHLLETRELRTIAVPTTYAGAEWTPFFGVRDEVRRTKGGASHELARPAAAIYDPALTVSLPRAQAVGTAMNALAHCAEALYVRGRNERADRKALGGARLIGEFLPLVVERPEHRYARTRLLEGAMSAALALGLSGLALGHALAQALGGRYGLPHGTLNAVCLPAALRFNREATADQLARFADALGTDDVITRVEELAALGGATRLRQLGVPEDELGEVAVAAVSRAGARANPRTVTAAQAEELLRSVW